MACFLERTEGDMIAVVVFPVADVGDEAATIPAIWERFHWMKEIRSSNQEGLCERDERSWHCSVVVASQMFGFCFEPNSPHSANPHSATSCLPAAATKDER